MNKAEDRLLAILIIYLLNSKSYAKIKTLCNLILVCYFLLNDWFYFTC